MINCHIATDTLTVIIKPLILYYKKFLSHTKMLRTEMNLGLNMSVSIYQLATRQFLHLAKKAINNDHQGPKTVISPE